MPSTSAALKAEEYWFDEAAAAAACAFFETYLRHTEGEWYGKPFALAAWQREIVRAAFGWKRADGNRKYRVIYIEIPRKNGKTEFAAGIALLLLVGDGEMGGQVYSMAVDKDQAKIVFNKATTMVEFKKPDGSLSALREIIEPFKTSLFCASLAKASFKPLSSNPGSKHGFSPTGAVADEIHEWPNGDLAQVVRDGMAARRQPMEVYLTTAGQHGRGFGWEMHDYALKVRDGIVNDPSFLPVIFAADAEDDWTDPAVWAKANPGLGVSPKLGFLESQCARAKDSPRLENNFRRFHLNQWTEQIERWLPMDKWDLGARETGWKDLRHAMVGRPCYAGLDLSTTTDLTAFVLVFPPEEETGPWTLVPWLWCPQNAIEVRARRDRAPYPAWVAQGILTATPGDEVDYARIRRTINELGEVYDIQEIPVDRWNAAQLIQQLGGEDGFTTFPFGQGYASMSAPSKEFERLVIGEHIEHGGHPALRWMASNVAIDEDAAGNIKPSKAKSSERIDGIVAAIMGVGRGMVAEPKNGIPIVVGF
jgi:phage terminase large subunit-like protein